ncbi:MAG: hypothetical protein MK212_14945 [Saprospiraceae bacterium]|nr:hypothetical protein [Saprospiraceae bacterium]
MKMTQLKQPLFYFISLVISLAYSSFSCTNTNHESHLTTATKVDSLEKDSLDLLISVLDTGGVPQGTVPTQWHKTLVDEKGYYIAFPKKPTIRNYSRKKQKIYKIERNKYALVLSKVDLSKDSVFIENRAERQNYCKAVFEDLAKEIEAKIDDIQYFDALDLYPSAEATLTAGQEIFYVRCITIGNTAYTISCVSFYGANDKISKLKDLFFNSFGKELFIE